MSALLTTNMSIVHWNMCGYKAKYQSLRKLLEDTNCSCICLQETMEDIHPLWKPGGYRVFSRRGPGVGHAGGVAILVRDSVPCVEVPLNTNLQAIAIKIKLERNYNVCSIYIPPNNAFKCSQLENIANQLSEPTLFLGDYNARHLQWGDTVGNNAGGEMLNFVQRNNFEILNGDFPTHVSFVHGTTSNIDLSVCSPEIGLHYEWLVSEDLYDSDHFPICLRPLVDDPVSINRRFIFDKADWNMFGAHSVPARSVDDFQSVDEAAQYIAEHIVSAAEASIPQTTGLMRAKAVPWWCAELTQATRETRRCLYTYINTKLPTDRAKYNRARAKFRSLRKQKRKESWKKYVSGINSDTKIDKIWQKIHRLNGKYKSIRPPVLKNNNGEIVTEPEEVAAMFGDSLSNISLGSQHPRFTRIRQSQSQRLNFNGGSQQKYNRVFTLDEFHNALHNTNSTAPGEDKITYQLIKHLPDNAIDYLLHLYNRIWQSNSFPKRWLLAVVLPFEKQGKDSLVVENYRPISLTSCVCKLMEKMVNARLVFTLEKCEAISEKQYGFRQGRSTTDVLVRLDSDIKLAFARKQHTIVVFFDLQKAYDTTWRQGILHRLHALGVGAYVEICQSFYLIFFPTENLW